MLAASLPLPLPPLQPLYNEHRALPTGTGGDGGEGEERGGLERALNPRRRSLAHTLIISLSHPCLVAGTGGDGGEREEGRGLERAADGGGTPRGGHLQGGGARCQGHILAHKKHPRRRTLQ